MTTTAMNIVAAEMSLSAITVDRYPSNYLAENRTKIVRLAHSITVDTLDEDLAELFDRVAIDLVNTEEMTASKLDQEITWYERAGYDHVYIETNRHRLAGVCARIAADPDGHGESFGELIRRIIIARLYR